jgi:hypothetical protein
MVGNAPAKRHSKPPSRPGSNQTARHTAPAAKLDDSEQRSAPPGATSEELVKYVLVELDVSRKNHKKFQQKMPDLVELMFDRARWELVFASYPITGIVNRFVHIWRIPDESTVVEVMRDGAIDLGRAQLPKAGTFEAEFRQVYMGVQELIDRTSHKLMTSLPYDPTHVGFQTQTILIDAEGEAFIIDHTTLRSAAKEGRLKGLTDVADELEQIRRSEFKRLNRALEPLSDHALSGKPVVKPDQDRLDSLKLLQMHLNRGSAVARLTFEGEQALLFNLASLKAKSVFQAVEPAPLTAEPKFNDSKAPANGKIDADVKRLLVTMPWGGVYDIKLEALQKKSLAAANLTGLIGTIPKTHQPATANALAPLLDSTPIAAIPTERDNIIGDGCACYVINLKSFKCC